MYNRDESLGPNFYLLQIFDHSEEDNELVGQILSEDPILVPDEGDRFQISSFQVGEVSGVGPGAGTSLEKEAEDTYIINNIRHKYSIVEREEEGRLYAHNTALIVEPAEE